MANAFEINSVEAHSLLMDQRQLFGPNLEALKMRGIDAYVATGQAQHLGSG